MTLHMRVTTFERFARVDVVMKLIDDDCISYVKSGITRGGKHIGSLARHIYTIFPLSVSDIREDDTFSSQQDGSTRDY